MLRLYGLQNGGLIGSLAGDCHGLDFGHRDSWTYDHKW